MSSKTCRDCGVTEEYDCLDDIQMFPVQQKKKNDGTVYRAILPSCRKCNQARKREYEKKLERDIYEAGYEMARLINNLFGINNRRAKER
jgi:hypothetical protein